MPTLSNAIWNKTTNDMYSNFYNNASIFRTCFFDIGFYGAYVDVALKTMKQNSVSDTKLNRIVPGTHTSDAFKQTGGDANIYTDAFKNFKKNFVDGEEIKDSGNIVRMRWTALSVDIPTVKAEIDTTYSIDAIKPLIYPLIKNYGGVRDLSLTIVDDRNQNLYQFFNSLQNAYFNQLELMPKSSFHKCGVWVAIAQGAPTNPKYYGIDEHSPDFSEKERGSGKNGVRKFDIDLAPVQLFEFNSIVMESMSNMKYTNQLDAKHMSFDVGFKVPNTFQETYSDTLRGLLDNTSGFGNRFRASNSNESNIGRGVSSDGNATIGGQWNESFFYYQPTGIVTED